MDNPREEISDVVHKLTQGSPAEQEATINAYFTPNASFIHPFCRTGSFDGSRNLILAIYRWYKILSPKIELNVNSVAYDESNLLLFLNISQIFSLWFIPFHHSHVTLTTELQLTRPPSSGKYYIKSQNDLYQNDQLIRFAMPFGVAEFFLHMWQYSSTLMCVFGAFLLGPITKVMERREENGGHLNVEDEMRGLVNSAMDGLQGKRAESSGKKRRDVGASAHAGSAEGAGASTGVSAYDGEVEQFGNMQVIS